MKKTEFTNTASTKPKRSIEEIKRTTEGYIKSIREELTSKHKTFKPSWEVTLLLFADTLTRYQQIRDEIDNGTIACDGERGMVKNPLLQVESMLINNLYRLTQKLGVSPWDNIKLGLNDTEDDTDDFIEALTN